MVLDGLGRVWKGLEGFGRVWKGLGGFGKGGEGWGWLCVTLQPTKRLTSPKGSPLRDPRSIESIESIEP